MQARHRDYFVALGEAAEPQLMGADQREWLDRLESEHDNLRLALDGSLGDKGSPEGLRLCSALQRYWWTRGYYAEGREWCVRALETPWGKERSLARANVLNGAGTLAHRQGDNVSAKAYLEECLTPKREFGDRAGIASSLNNLGSVASHQSDYASARSYLEEGLTIRQEIGDQIGIATSLEGFASLSAKERRSDETAVLLAAAEALRKRIGAPLPPHEREDFDGEVAKSRQALGAEAFSMAWATGAAMTLEQAIDYVYSVGQEGA